MTEYKRLKMDFIWRVRLNQSTNRSINRLVTSLARQSSRRWHRMASQLISMQVHGQFALWASPFWAVAQFQTDDLFENFIWPKSLFGPHHLQMIDGWGTHMKMSLAPRGDTEAIFWASAWQDADSNKEMSHQLPVTWAPPRFFLDLHSAFRDSGHNGTAIAFLCIFTSLVIIFKSRWTLHAIQTASLNKPQIKNQL